MNSRGVQVSVASEIGPAELVITSAPGREFEYMVPENLERYRPGPGGQPLPNPHYLLFDDLVLLSSLRAEYEALAAVIRAVTGEAGQVDFRWLLASALSSPDAREEVIEGVLELEATTWGRPASEETAAALRDLDATRLAEALITGREAPGGRHLLTWPAPNVLFARDLAAAVGDALALTYAAEPGRRRDMLLMRVVLRHHTLLSSIDRLDVNDDAAEALVTLEGGDVQVLDGRVVLVGVGLRTSLEAAERLAQRLFPRGVEAVLACRLPRRRAAMHIDTLFTQIDRGHCLVYPPMVEAPAEIGLEVHTLTPAEPEAGATRPSTDLLGALAAVGVELEPLRCGGSDPFAQAREQWSDGANAFALAPGVILCYARNPHTLAELSRAGYEIVTPERFIPNAPRYVSDPEARVAVTLTGHELVRGRGGPRCLTLPLRRAALG